MKICIKTKEGASLIIGLISALCVAACMLLLHGVWWMALCAALAVPSVGLGLQAQADLLDCPFARRPYARGAL